MSAVRWRLFTVIFRLGGSSEIAAYLKLHQLNDMDCRYYEF